MGERAVEVSGIHGWELNKLTCGCNVAMGTRSTGPWSLRNGQCYSSAV